MGRNKIVIACIFLGLVVSCGPDVPQTPEPNQIAGEKDVSELSPELLAGRSLFRANGCETCHGVQGRGDGPAGAGLNPPPRNLQDTGAYKQGASEDAIVQTLFTGVPGTLMQPYPHVKEQDRRLIAQYVIYLRSQTDRRP